MNIKEIKEQTEKNIVSVIKQMVAQTVEVQALYDIEHNNINLLLVDQQKQDETPVKIIVYNCVYYIENQLLSVTGFARKYGYDNFGIAVVENEPVTVDEPFINGIKAGIAQGLNAEPEEAPAEAPAEEVVEEDK